jgi:hypothetical protein
MVALAVEGRIGQDAVPGQSQRRLGHDLRQLRRIIGGAGRDRGPGDEVTGGIDRDGQLGPESGSVATSGSLEEVARGVAAFQAGAINSGGRSRADQAAPSCARSGPVKEADNLPFFKSLWAA